jgi:16S rRNA (cytidine1402-2'-O)-methyltransferase
MEKNTMSKGKLFLIPNTLGSDYDFCTAKSTLSRIEHIRHFVVEELRSARRLLKGMGYPTDFAEVEFYLLNEHSDAGTASKLLSPLKNGHDIGLISEAGCPAIADPGEDLVLLAQENGISVVPLVGASSILLTLMASGLNGESFAFTGYVPRESDLRVKRLRNLENAAIQTGQTQLFMEAPYRNNALLQDILTHLKPETRLCIAADLTTENEYIRTAKIGEWKKGGLPELHKRPVMFAIGK